MMVFGIDPHKQTHTAVAVDELGRRKAERTVAARREGHLQLLVWAGKLTTDRVWAVEDVRHVAGNLVRDLLAAGEKVIPVPPKMMAAERRGGREHGKSDPIDALAIARLALRERADLPLAVLDEHTRPIRLLVDHRDALIKERTRVINRFRWMLHDLALDLAPARRTLAHSATRVRLAAQLAALPESTSRRVACAQLTHIDLLSTQANAVEAELKALVEPLATGLLAVTGVSVLTAAKLLGEIGDIRRFRTTAAFARHNGTAPIPVWSGKSEVHRLNRAGNRQLNAALHRIALTQSRCHPGARQLLERRRQTHHDTTKGGLRVLKRHLSDVVYRVMIADIEARDIAPTQAHQAVA
ncbi:IS110 family transposase [Streptosporangium sp. NPDC005286]|uniref:IS110 family transposase n=1 Tax=Streptosporangium sp. NPDC005286 TaxID=3154463 RepID=UPI0033BA6DFD